MDEEFVDKILALDAKDLSAITGGLTGATAERYYFERLEHG